MWSRPDPKQFSRRRSWFCPEPGIQHNITVILIVDHSDSFTYNLFHLFRRTGRDAAVVHYRELAQDQLSAAEGIVLGPGPHSPEDVPESVGLFRRAMQLDKPVLGVCLGHQIIGASLGARVIHASKTEHGVISAVHHTGRGLFKGLDNPAGFVCYHSLVLARPLPEALVEIGRDEHGDVAAIQHAEKPVWGVQFHPESALSSWGESLIRNFLREAGL